MEQIEEKFNAMLPALLAAVEAEIKEWPHAVASAVLTHRHYLEQIYRSCDIKPVEDDLTAFVDSIYEEATKRGEAGRATAYLVPCTTSLLNMIQEIIRAKVRQRTLDRTRLVLVGSVGHHRNLADVLRKLVGDVEQGDRLPTMSQLMAEDLPCPEEPVFELGRRKTASEVPFLTKNKRDIYRNTRGGGRRR